MAGFLTGPFAKVKFIHGFPHPNEDDDEIGPGAYTLRDGAVINQAGPFEPLGVLRTNATTKRLTSDLAVAGLDISDTAKTLTQFFWTPLAPLLGAENTFLSFRNAGETDHKLRMGRDTGTGGFYARYHRSADLTPGNPTIEIKASESDIVDVNATYSNIIYLNANSVAEGKWFVAGVDRTTSVTATAGASVPATGFDFLTFGNHPEGLTHPVGNLDHVTILQDPAMTDAIAAAIATQYHDTRAMGFRPAFGSLDKQIGEVGDAITLFGSGFGLDVVVSIDGVPVDSQVRVTNQNGVSDSEITFVIPNVATGIKNIKILNVQSGVAFEEIAVLAVIPNLVYAGDFAKLILFHPLGSANGDIVGPSDYFVDGVFTATGAKFGKGFQAANSGEAFSSNVGVAGYDGSDGNKTIMHFNWTPTGAGGIQTLVNFINSGFTGAGIVLDYNAGGGERLKIIRNRAVNLPSGKNEIEVKSKLVDTTPPSLLSIAAYIDGGSISQGKIFVNGVDETDTVTEDSVAVVDRGNLLVMANDLTFSQNANVMDELAVIQDPAMTDSKMTTLVTNCDDTRAFGYRPICINLSVLTGSAGTPVSLLGQGFGKDVQVFFNGTPVDSLVRVNEGLVTFVVPVMPPGLVDVKIDNVSANVQVTVQNGFEVNLFGFFSASATERRKVEVIFEQDIKQVDPSNLDDALNPLNYTLRPVNTPKFTAAFTPTVIEVNTIDANTVELFVDDDLSYGLDYEVAVLNVQSTAGGDLDPINRDFIFTAVDPRPEHRI